MAYLTILLQEYKINKIARDWFTDTFFRCYTACGLERKSFLLGKQAILVMNINKKEKAMRVVIQDDYSKMCKWAADYIAEKIKAHQAGPEAERPFVLGLPTGSSPIGVYKELIAKNKSGELSFSNVVTFNMDEYLGLPHEHDQSYWYFMHDNFFDHLVDMKPENINILIGMTDDPEGECAR